MAERGHYIVFEGGEGAGKTTQIFRIKDYLISNGIPVETVREPGGTPFGDELRGILLETREELDPLDEFLLFSAARSHLKKVINRYLSQGISILSDRSGLSSIAYQCYGSGLSLEFVELVTSFIMGELQPDIVIILDVDYEIGMQRRHGRGATDRIELRESEFHHRVRQGFLTEAQKYGHPIIDANQSTDDVALEVQTHIDVIINSPIYVVGSN